MKKLKVKGFTLIECIVAMAIIGIASLLMAQVYGAVAIMNKRNAALNTTLVEQMKIAEQKLDSDSSGNVSFHKGAGLKTGSSAPSGYNEFKVDPLKFEATGGAKKDKFKTQLPETEMKIVVLKANDAAKTTATSDGRSFSLDSDVNYKFMLPIN